MDRPQSDRYYARHSSEWLAVVKEQFTIPEESRPNEFLFRLCSITVAHRPDILRKRVWVT
jgi:hypothetical protein